MTKKERNRLSYLKHKEKRLHAMRIYYQSNKDVIKKRSSDWYLKNKDNPSFIEKRKAKTKETYLKTRDEKLKWQQENHKKRRIEFLTKIGGCSCKNCGYSDWRALQIDHVFGGGNEERREHGGKTGAITRKKQEELIEMNPEKYQVLCANCNWIKKYERKESAQKRLQTVI